MVLLMLICLVVNINFQFLTEKELSLLSEARYNYVEGNVIYHR